MSAAHPLEAEGVICRIARRGGRLPRLQVQRGRQPTRRCGRSLEEPGRYALVGLSVSHPGAAPGAAPLTAAARARDTHHGHLLRHDPGAARDRRPRPPGRARPRGSARRLVQGAGRGREGCVWWTGTARSAGATYAGLHSTAGSWRSRRRAAASARTRWRSSPTSPSATPGSNASPGSDGVERHHRAHARRRAPCLRTPPALSCCRPRAPRRCVASQAETRLVKRDVCRGRLWLRSAGPAGRMPNYPGLDLSASPSDRLRGVADAAQERLFRSTRRQALSGLSLRSSNGRTSGKTNRGSTSG